MSRGAQSTSVTRVRPLPDTSPGREPARARVAFVIETVWLDNPPVNAVDSRMIATLTEALGDLAPETRVVVLRGAGERAFSAGADIASFGRASSDEPPGGIQPIANLIETCPV